MSVSPSNLVIYKSQVINYLTPDLDVASQEHSYFRCLQIYFQIVNVRVFVIANEINVFVCLLVMAKLKLKKLCSSVYQNLWKNGSRTLYHNLFRAEQITWLLHTVFHYITIIFCAQCNHHVFLCKWQPYSPFHCHYP